MKVGRTAVVAAAAAGLVAVEAYAGACGAKCGVTVKKAAAEKHHHHGYTTVDTAGLKKMIATGKEMVLVDARSGKYDDGRRIAGASQLSPDASDKDVMAALPDKNAKIVAYCTSNKCPASAKLAHRLADMGYRNVVKYPGGIDAWVKGGNAVSKN